MRNNTYNPAREIVKEAVRATHSDRTQSTLPSTSAAVPFGGTSLGTDGDGNMFTIHPMLWDLDKWDDEGSVWL